jgi:hypothetical protein
MLKNLDNLRGLNKITRIEPLSEQIMDYINDINQTQRISKETVEHLRDLREKTEDGPTTQKINKRLSAAEERILKQIAPVVETIQQHDSWINFACRKFGIKKQKRV